MATTQYFNESVKDQEGETVLDIEIGRSSYYPDHSIYIEVDGKTVIMTPEIAKKFVDSVVSVGHYFGFVEE